MRFFMASACLFLGSLAANATEAEVIPADSIAVLKPTSDVATVPEMPEPVAARWGGIYAGVSTGYGSIKDSFPDQAKGWIYGAYVGYNHQWGNFVVGVEASFDRTDLGFETLSNTGGDYILAGRARAGWANELLFVYGSLGVEHGVTEGLPAAYAKDSTLQLGAGVDVAVTRNLSLGVDFTHAKYKDFSNLSDLFARPIDVTTQKLTARLTYTFN